jgi:hypothetical protein
MSTKTLIPQIALVQEQINNFEKSGFFTDKEIESKTMPLRIELASLKMQQEFLNISESVCKFGMSLESYIEGTKAFNECFDQLKDLPTSLLNIEVVDAEILTPNHITE